MSNDLRSVVQTGPTKPAQRVPSNRLKIAGGAAAIALTAGAALILMSVGGRGADRGPIEARGQAATFPDPASLPETRETLPTPGPATIVLPEGETNPLPPMRGPWGGAELEAAGWVGAALADLESRRFRDLNTRLDRLASPDAASLSGAPLSADLVDALLDGRLQGNSINRVMKAAAAYREAFPLSSRPRLIEAALLSHQAQLLFRELGEDGAPAKQSAAYQTATRDLVTYLEASRALLDLEPSARLIRIDLLGRAGAYGSVRTEVEAVASAYPRMSQAYARAARYVHPGSVESVSALRELGRVALLHAPEAERLKTYARIQLALADAWTSRLYSDTLLDRDAFHAGLVELLNAHPDPRLYSQAAMIACDNRDHHLARLVLQRLEVVPAEQIVWDLMKGHVAFDRCRRTVIRNYRNASQGP